MSLQHAILGFLNYKPFSGYDLKKVFDTSVRHFWSADQSQIYRTLSRLTDRGLVELEYVEQEDRPDRKVYHITEAGREALRQWLHAPLPFEKSRHAPLIQVFFAGQLEDEQILNMFECQAEQVRALLAHYQTVPAQAEPYSQMVGSARETYFWMLTLEMGAKLAEAQLAWLEDVIERIKNKTHPSS
ncbi:MAG: PadR family transcriptional regulator [Anaerolineae bacterium]|nr:PadR family transcriptional regulator [Anaerolineae bacterium]